MAPKNNVTLEPLGPKLAHSLSGLDRDMSNLLPDSFGIAKASPPFEVSQPISHVDLLSKMIDPVVVSRAGARGALCIRRRLEWFVRSLLEEFEEAGHPAQHYLRDATSSSEYNACGRLYLSSLFQRQSEGQLKRAVRFSTVSSLYVRSMRQPHEASTTTCASAWVRTTTNAPRAAAFCFCSGWQALRASPSATSEARRHSTYVEEREGSAALTQATPRVASPSGRKSWYTSGGRLR